MEQDNQQYIDAYNAILQTNDSYVSDSDETDDNKPAAKMCKYKIAYLKNAVYGTKKTKYVKTSANCKYIDVYTNQHGEVVHFGNAVGSQKHTNEILKHKAKAQDLQNAQRANEAVTKDIL